MGAAALLLALVGGAAGVAAQSGEPPIPSDAPGALDRPQSWNCQRIEPDYQRWLDDGNLPESWKFAGKTYRDVESGKLYDWKDWLSWANDAGCLATSNNVANVANAAVPTTNIIIGGAIVALGAGLVSASEGSAPKSPG